MPTAHHKLPALILIAVALVGAARLLLATQTWGIGVDTDGVVFLSAAQSVLRGTGITALLDGTIAPLTHFPPLYPLLLAAVGATDLSSLAGARWMNACLFAAHITLVGIIVRTYAPDTRWLPVMVAGLLALSPDMVLVHTIVLTEPVFLFTAFSGLFLIARYIEEPALPRFLLAALATGLAFLVRYPGVVCVLTGAIALLLYNRTSYRKRITDTALFVLISCLPMAAWMLRNALMDGTATNRTLVVHPLTTGHIQSFFYTLSTWVLPYSRLYPLDPGLRIVLMAVIVGGLAFVFRRRSRSTHTTQEGAGGVLAHSVPHGHPARNATLRGSVSPLLAVLGTFVGVYLGFVALSISLLDLSTPLDYRILLPVHVAVVLLVAGAIPTSGNYVLAGLWGVLMVLSLISSQELLHTIHTDGWSYSGNAWRKSGLIEEIRTLPAETHIYTNAPDAVYLHTGRVLAILPYKIERTSRLPRDTIYTTELAALYADVVQHGAVIAYFSTITWRDYLPSEEELRQQLPLVPIATRWDGTIYTGKEPHILPRSGKEVDSRTDATSAQTGQRPDSLSTCSPVFGIIPSSGKEVKTTRWGTCSHVGQSFLGLRPKPRLWCRCLRLRPNQRHHKRISVGVGTPTPCFISRM